MDLNHEDACSQFRRSSTRWASQRADGSYDSTAAGPRNPRGTRARCPERLRKLSIIANLSPAAVAVLARLPSAPLRAASAAAQTLPSSLDHTRGCDVSGCCVNINIATTSSRPADKASTQPEHHRTDAPGQLGTRTSAGAPATLHQDSGSSLPCPRPAQDLRRSLSVQTLPAKQDTAQPHLVHVHALAAALEGDKASTHKSLKLPSHDLPKAGAQGHCSAPPAPRHTPPISPTAGRHSRHAASSSDLRLRPAHSLPAPRPAHSLPAPRPALSLPAPRPALSLPAPRPRPSDYSSDACALVTSFPQTAPGLQASKAPQRPFQCMSVPGSTQDLTTLDWTADEPAVMLGWTPAGSVDFVISIAQQALNTELLRGHSSHCPGLQAGREAAAAEEAFKSQQQLVDTAGGWQLELASPAMGLPDTAIGQLDQQPGASSLLVRASDSGRFQGPGSGGLALPADGLRTCQSSRDCNKSVRSTRWVRACPSAAAAAGDRGHGSTAVSCGLGWWSLMKRLKCKLG